MGVVYKAHDVRLDRLVAIKLLLPKEVADPERIRRFVQEAQAVAALNHPNIAQIYDFDEADGIRWLAWNSWRVNPLPTATLAVT